MNAAGRRTQQMATDSGYLEGLRREDAKNDPAGSLESYRAWMGPRMVDVAYLIDHVRDSAAVPGAAVPFGLADISRIGVMGHSLGGSATVGIGPLDKPDGNH